MLLGLETFSYHLFFRWDKMDVFEFARKTRELGLDGVQLHWRHFESLDPDRLPQLRRLTDDLGLYVEVDTPFFERAHLEKMLHICATLGAQVLRTYVSTPDLIDGEQQRGYSAAQLPAQLAAAPDLLRQLLPLCAQLGVRIAVENHEYETSDDMLRVVRAVDSEWVGLLIDNGNSMMVWEDPSSATGAMAPHALSTHFKDHLVIVEDEQPAVIGVPLGRGSMDLDDSFRILATETALQRVNIEVCYAYRAPFRRTQQEGAGGRLGEGAFRIHEPPYDPATIAPFPLPTATSERAQLLAWQEQAVIDSVAHVKQLNDRLG
jgi:3-oxoisoapionate decarboxylase